MAWGVPKLGAVAETTVAGGNLTLAEPSGVAQGDLMVACIAYRDTPAFTLPSGWALVATQQSSGDTDTTDGIGSGVMAYIVRGASAPALTWTRTAGNVARGCIVSYSGTDATPYDTGSANTLAVASATVTTGTITTAAAGELIVAMLAGGDNYSVSAFDAATDPTTASGATDTTTAPTDGTWIERVDSGTNTGADTVIAIADAVRATAGATGTIQCTTSGAGRSVMIAGAFKISTTVTGTLSVTEPLDTISGTSTVAVNATATPTEPLDTISATAIVTVKAFQSDAFQVDAFQTYYDPATGTLSVTEPLDTLSGVATVAVAASLTATEPLDTVSGAATVAVSSSLSSVEPLDTVAGAATVAVAASLAVAEPLDTISATATVDITASLSATEPLDTIAGTAEVTTAAAVGTLDVAEPLDTLAGTATIEVTATATPTEPLDTLSATAAIDVMAVFAAAEPLDTLIANATVGIVAALDIAEPLDTLSGIGSVISGITGTLDVTEPLDTLSGTAEVTGAAAVEEANTGGWIDPKVARALLRQAQAYQKAAERKRVAERAAVEARKEALNATMERIYAEITGEALPTLETLNTRLDAPQPEAPNRAVADAIAVYMAVVEMNDFGAMRAALEALDNAILRLRIEMAERDDEEAILLLI
jgi:hypothetical protein